ncbi:hypothetical protein NUW58_g974 [Xylaria curta]|uniref:Uncharacterized protein n=1 Tax=Xylaria curta TaxID=42375 RepID=A0ACC1PNE2_9PEZI|nr:hypothetical protein NUW58_g974 [Xylaria curta]
MEENMSRPSGLKQPSVTRLGSSIPLSSSQHNHGLHEISDSQNNARAQYTVTGSVGGMKRPIPDSALVSESKRKPIGSGLEYQRKPPATLMAGGKPKPASLKDLHQPSSTKNASLRQPSNSSYSSSSSYGSYGNSVGPGARPVSRSHSRTRSVPRTARPATSMDTREVIQESNGTVPQQSALSAFTVQNTSKLHIKKARRRKPTPPRSSSKSSCPSMKREVSFLTATMNNMSLDSESEREQGNQASSDIDANSAPTSLPGPAPSPQKCGNYTLRPRKYIREERQDSQVALKTPSISERYVGLERSIKAITPGRGAFPSSPTKLFLNKHSNLTSFTAHAISEKVGKMDNDIAEFREFMKSAEKNNAHAKEELELSKKRVISLEEEKIELQSDRTRLKDKLQDAERQVSKLQYDLEEQQSRHERRYKILEEDHKREMERQTEEYKREMDKNEKLQQEFESRCGAEAEARLEGLSQDNKELRNTLEKQKRDHEHEIRLLHETIQRRDTDVRRIEDELRKANNEQFDLQTQIRGNNETIERLRKRAEDAEERLSKDKGHLGGQISLLSSTLDLKSERIQTLEENVQKLQADCELEIRNIKLAAEKKIAEETALLRERLMKEEERRHNLFEQVQELKGNIRVMCRIKPPSDPAKDALIPFKPQWNEIDEDRIDGLTIPTVREDPTEPGRMLPGKPREFNFERVFDERCNNKDVFDEISQLVQSVMDGKKVCIFCYGQTGSGKTFTMSKRQGDGDDGVIPRTQGMVFGEMERLKTLGWEYTVEGSYLEVYQDKLYDLLASRHSKPEPLAVDPIADELKIKGHDFTLLNDAQDLDEMIKTADNNRHVAATVKNDRSSRSHSILVLKVTGVKKNENGDVIKTRKGTLNLIDLAGSEKPDKDGPAQVYKEGVEINSSLSYLRTVLSSLGQGKTEGVDFRSYTLTQLLRPSLGKGCRTLMFVMVSPLKENENETIRSLEFARDAQKVKMGGWLPVAGFMITEVAPSTSLTFSGSLATVGFVHGVVSPSPRPSAKPTPSTSNVDRKRTCPPLARAPGTTTTYSQGAMPRETGSGSAGTAPTYVESQHRRDPSGPHGKNIKEDDSIGTGDNAKNASFTAEIGSKDDPSLLAERRFNQLNSVAPGSSGGRESASHEKTTYDVLGDREAFISKAYNAFDYVEAQLIERLPQYLQHEWSLYQQRRPERARLPPYQYRPLNTGDFRLFILKKSSFYPSVIHGEIVHTPTHPPPDYEAVSYRWGSPETTEEIIVDGCRLRVTKSAFDLLLARRSVWRERRIWIDAICINQKDVQEKSEQVQLMRDIYHRASRVISFPGGGWRNRLAGAFVYELWSLVYQYNSDAMNWSATPNEAKTLRWRAMADLFSNEYFNRAWVIQEIAVGKKTELYVGGIYLPWMAFAEVVDWCFHSNRRHMLSGSYDKERRVWRTGRTFENIAVMTTLRPEAEGWTGAIGSFSDLTSLEKLIYITFNFEAADPRDKVYGLMGIARNTGDLTLAAPDYSLPAEQVFENVTRAIFSLPTERKTIHILAIAGTGFSERSRPMPSWVPDFSEERICYPYATVLKTHTCFRASGDIPQDMRLEDETDSLIVKAMKIDRVLELSAFGALDWKLHDLELTDVFKTLKILHGFVHAAIDLYKKHAISPGTTDESTHERLWSAFIAGRVERKPADVKFKEVFQHWLHHLDLIAGARDRAHYNRLIKEGALGDGWVFTNDGTETTYQHSVMEACFGRRIAVTVSGRLCIVPPLTKVGDSVIIPLGSQTPFLIRQCHDVPESIGDELVGEAWVEGVMQGEMIGNADEELIRIS